MSWAKSCCSAEPAIGPRTATHEPIAERKSKTIGNRDISKPGRRAVCLSCAGADEFFQRLLPFFNNCARVELAHRHGRRTHATDRTKLYCIDGNGNPFKDL